MKHYRDLAFRCLTIRRLLPKPSPPTSGSPPSSSGGAAGAAWRTPPQLHREQGPRHRSVSLLPEPNASFSSEFPPLLRRSTTAPALRSEPLLALLPRTPPPPSGAKSKRKQQQQQQRSAANSAPEIPVPPRPARVARGSAPAAAAAASHSRKARFVGSTPPRSAASKIQGRHEPAASIRPAFSASFFRLLRRPFSTGTPPPPPPAAAQPPRTSTSSKRRRRRRNKQSAANSPASGRPIGQALPPAGGPGGSAAVSARGQAPAGSSSPVGPQKRKRSSPPSRPPPTPTPADLSAAESTCERYYYAAGKRVCVAASKWAAIKAAREREYLEWYSSGDSRFVFGGVIDSFYVPEILHRFRLQTDEEIESWKLRVNAISFPPAHPGFRQPRKAHIAAKFGRFVVHRGRSRRNERAHHLMVVSLHDPRIVYSVANFGRKFYNAYLSALIFYEYAHSSLYPEYLRGHKRFGPWQKM